jgi:hypothetical protein
MESVIYADNPPPRSIWYKVVPLVYAAFIVLLSAFHLSDSVSLEILVRGLIIPVLVFPPIVAIYYWATTPRSYQIFEDRLEIIQGGKFFYSLPFNNIARAEEGSWPNLWISKNFVTCQSREHLITIITVKDEVINISPTNRDIFLYKLNQACKKWKSEEIAQQFTRKN